MDFAHTMHGISSFPAVFATFSNDIFPFPQWRFSEAPLGIYPLLRGDVRQTARGLPLHVIYQRIT